MIAFVTKFLCFPNREAAVRMYKQLYTAITGKPVPNDFETIPQSGMYYSIVEDVTPMERVNEYDLEGNVVTQGTNDGKYYVMIRCTQNIADLVPAAIITDKPINNEFYDS